MDSRDPPVGGWSQGHGQGRPAREFLEISKQKWTGIIEATVRASVEELAYMNRVRFSTSSQNSIFDSDDPKSSCASDENLLNMGNKRKVPRGSETSGPGKPDGSKLMVTTDSSTAPRLFRVYC